VARNSRVGRVSNPRAFRCRLAAAIWCRCRFRSSRRSASSARSMSSAAPRTDPATSSMRTPAREASARRIAGWDAADRLTPETADPSRRPSSIATRPARSPTASRRARGSLISAGPPRRRARCERGRAAVTELAHPSRQRIGPSECGENWRVIAGERRTTASSATGSEGSRARAGGNPCERRFPQLHQPARDSIAIDHDRPHAR
jgi:hypothetical protein